MNINDLINHLTSIPEEMRTYEVRLLIGSSEEVTKQVKEGLTTLFPRIKYNYTKLEEQGFCDINNKVFYLIPK